MQYNILMGLTIGIVAAYAVMLIFYLRAETKNTGAAGFRKATGTKLTLSGLFCVTAVISFYMMLRYGHSSDILYTMQMLVMLGLFAAFAGDFFLQYIRIDTKKYMIGIACFTVTQVLFIVSQTILNMLSGWLLTLVIMAAVLAGILVLMKRQGWKLGKEKKLLTAYTVLLTFMMAKSVATMFHDKTIGAVFMGVGAALFLLSDLFLGIWNYRSNRRVYANLNWITYFSGMLLIALSSNPAFSVALGY